MPGEELTADNWQPSMQMFESLASMMSPGGSKQDISDIRSQAQQRLVERNSVQELTNIMTINAKDNSLMRTDETEFSFQATNDYKGARGNSLGRQNAKARLAALKQSKCKV